jgi:hypothetical protein
VRPASSLPASNAGTSRRRCSACVGSIGTSSLRKGPIRRAGDSVDGIDEVTEHGADCRRPGLWVPAFAGPTPVATFGGCGTTRRANHFGLSEDVSSPRCKNISVLQKPRSGYITAMPSQSGGRCARSPMRDGDAVDADGALDPGAGSGRAKSCGPDTPRLVSSSRLKAARATVAKVHGSPRRSPISRKPLRGECRVIPV